MRLSPDARVAEPLLGGPVAGHLARHGHAQRAVGGELGLAAEHVRAGGGGRGLPGVQAVGGARGGVVDGHHEAAAQPHALHTTVVSRYR